MYPKQWGNKTTTYSANNKPTYRYIDWKKVKTFVMHPHSFFFLHHKTVLSKRVKYLNKNYIFGTIMYNKVITLFIPGGINKLYIPQNGACKNYNSSWKKTSYHTAMSTERQKCYGFWNMVDLTTKTVQFLRSYNNGSSMNSISAKKNKTLATLSNTHA